ncbi:MAG: hypothetical protein Q4D06_07510 [Coriobacteriia bacterium]|nr:hypothetical protein [Coriobacteriia bacterium]
MDNPAIAEALVNVQTNGMEQYGHLDFQCVLPMGDQPITNLFNMLVGMVQSGEVFKSEEPLLDGDNLIAALYEVEDAGRRVLRVLVCEPHLFGCMSVMPDELIFAQADGTPFRFERQDGELALIWPED